MDAPVARRRIARTWFFRAEAERASSERFARLARELREVEAEAVVVRMAEEAAADETRHEQLCIALGRRYDPDALPEHPHAAGPVGARGSEKRDRVLYEVVAFCCIAETMNVAVLTESQRRATDPIVRDAIHEILRDEVAHARIGWAHLASERASGRGEFLTAALPRMLANAHAETVFGHEENDDDADVAHGEVSRATMRRTVQETLETVIFPGLRMHGVDTTEAERWLDTLTHPS